MLPLAASPCQVYVQHGGHANWNIWGWNEYVVSAPRWNQGLPWIIQAIFYVCGNTNARNSAYLKRGDFLRAYPELERWRVPVVCLNLRNGGTPFSPGERQ